MELRMYLVETPLGLRKWHAEDEAHAREQHTEAFPDEPIIDCWGED